MLIPSDDSSAYMYTSSLSRRVNANSQLLPSNSRQYNKLIKKGEC